MKKLLGLLAVAPMALAACGGTAEVTGPSKSTLVVNTEDKTVGGFFLGHGEYGQEATVAEGGRYNAIKVMATYDDQATGGAAITVSLQESTGYVNTATMGYTLSESDIHEDGRYIMSLFNVTEIVKDHATMEYKTDDNYGGTEATSFHFVTGISDPAEAGFAAATCDEIKAWEFDTTKKDGTGLGTSAISSATTTVDGTGASELSLYLAAMQNVANKACSEFETA